MNLNPEIERILDHYKINYSDGLLCLLSIYYDLEDNSRIPEEIHKQINLTKIVERNYEDRSKVIWNVPLFEEVVTSDPNWDWIKEWREMFGALRSDAIGTKSAVEKKMKEFFSKNPEVRKTDIIESTKIYLNQFHREPSKVKYLQKADNYIAKREIVEGKAYPQSRLEMYLEIYNKNKGLSLPAPKQLSQVVKAN